MHILVILYFNSRIWSFAWQLSFDLKLWFLFKVRYAKFKMFLKSFGPWNAWNWRLNHKHWVPKILKFRFFENPNRTCGLRSRTCGQPPLFQFAFYFFIAHVELTCGGAVVLAARPSARAIFKTTSVLFSLNFLDLWASICMVFTCISNSYAYHEHKIN